MTGPPRGRQGFAPCLYQPLPPPPPPLTLGRWGGGGAGKGRACPEAGFSTLSIMDPLAIAILAVLAVGLTIRAFFAHERPSEPQNRPETASGSHVDHSEDLSPLWNELAAISRRLDDIDARHSLDRAEWLDKITRAFNRLRARQQREKELTDEQAALLDPPETKGSLERILERRIVGRRR